MAWVNTSVTVVSMSADDVVVSVGPHTFNIPVEEIKDIVQGHMPLQVLKANIALYLAIAAVNLGSAAAVKTAIEGTTFRFPG